MGTDNRRPAPTGKAAAPEAAQADPDTAAPEEAPELEAAEEREALARQIASTGGHDPDGFYHGKRYWEWALPDAERFIAAFDFIVTRRAERMGRIDAEEGANGQ